MNAHLPRIETKGDEPLPDPGAWGAIAPLGDLVDARSGAVPRDRTTLRAAAGAAALHVVFDCDDRDIWATHALRDAPLWEEEVVEVFIAPGRGDPARYVELEISPAGILFDALVHNPDGRRETMTVDRAWTAPGLVGRVSRPRHGAWRAELAIPWTAIGRPEDSGGAWRANFFRVERSHGDAAEFSAWAPTGVEPPDFHKPRSFGLLVIP